MLWRFHYTPPMQVMGRFPVRKILWKQWYLFLLRHTLCVFGIKELNRISKRRIPVNYSLAFGGLFRNRQNTGSRRAVGLERPQNSSNSRVKLSHCSNFCPLCLSLSHFLWPWWVRYTSYSVHSLRIQCIRYTGGST